MLGRCAVSDEQNLTAKAARKLRRRASNDRLARDAKFWAKPRSAEQMGYTKPVNKQAAKELSGRRDSKCDEQR